MIRLFFLIVFFFYFLIKNIPAMIKDKKRAAKKNPEDDVLFQRISISFGKGVMWVAGCKARVAGIKHVPLKGAVIFIGNHEGNFDIPLLFSALPKPVGFIAKSEMRKIPLMSTWMEIIRCVFIDRNSRKGAIASIHDSVAHLKNGHSLIVFPEGTRSGGEEVGKFKSGAFRIAKDSQVPIVPFVIAGTSEVFEQNKYAIKPKELYLKVLDVITPEETSQLSTNELANKVEALIRNEQINLQRVRKENINSLK